MDPAKWDVQNRVHIHDAVYAGPTAPSENGARRCKELLTSTCVDLEDERPGYSHPATGAVVLDGTGVAPGVEGGVTSGLGAGVPTVDVGVGVGSVTAGAGVSPAAEETGVNPGVGASILVVVVGVSVDSVSVGTGVSTAADGTRLAPVVGAEVVATMEAGVRPISVGMKGAGVPPPETARQPTICTDSNNEPHHVIAAETVTKTKPRVCGPRSKHPGRRRPTLDRGPEESGRRPRATQGRCYHRRLRAPRAPRKAKESRKARGRWPAKAKEPPQRRRRHPAESAGPAGAEEPAAAGLRPREQRPPPSGAQRSAPPERRTRWAPLTAEVAVAMSPAAGAPPPNRRGCESRARKCTSQRRKRRQLDGYESLARHRHGARYSRGIRPYVAQRIDARKTERAKTLFRL